MKCTMHLALCFLLAVSATPAYAGRKVRRLGAPQGTNNSLSLVPGDATSLSEKTARLGTDSFSIFCSLNRSQEDFMPACLRHIRDIVAEADYAYTDHQLEAVLMDQCWLEKTFPSAHEDGFDHMQDCAQFASELKKARYQELKNGNTDGYQQLCEGYRAHKFKDYKKATNDVKRNSTSLSGSNGTQAESAEKEKSDKGQNGTAMVGVWGVIGIIVVVAISLVVYILMKRKQAA
eukprot:gnl/TRDRNA2_/TRDRNA2_181284_c0_seq1.p1 gnl/TRDRNA2_/TRDRNA2_181284_c0~~gnl/TRDRNA2_/TRDRNA2_181284_c0_seq1.p1  ORF type:complete len:233 (-),score=45.95 gnl/TRDRNA2_/TRDRNA2_181284_c0_seq1:142-840(-)